ncbi:MAG: AAA family ATPase, partial [Chloroflexi bacterium]
MPHVISDDLTVLLAVLPPYVREAVSQMEDCDGLLEIVLDLGRLPEGRFPDKEVALSTNPVTAEDVKYVVERIGQFGGDNRAGIERTLHRI